jgi:2-dehydropantoate 2-reductase
VGPADLVLVFVKCYHTEDAARAARPLLGPETAVLSLQNGWGNAPRLAAVLGKERVLAGVTYHSATVVAPGHVHHTGRGVTVLGELDGARTPRLGRIAETLSGAGLEVRPTDKVLEEIWSKLALNCCTLPTSALLRFLADELIRDPHTAELMRGILREVIAVANAQGIPLAYDERWETIRGLLERAVGGKSSMLQDVEKGRRTEIDVINGAVVEAGKRLGIPTPVNEVMVGMVRALEGALARGRKT